MKISEGLLFAVLTICYNEVDSLDILAILPFQGKSHFFAFEPYLKELAKRGHNVTVISYFPQKQPLENYTDISFAGKRKAYEDVIDTDQTILTSFKLFISFMDSSIDNCKVLVEDQSVQNLVKLQTKFDLVLVEAFLSDCALGVAYKLGAPVVALTSHMLLPIHYDRFAVPFQFLHSRPDPDFFKRCFITAYHKCLKILVSWYMNSERKIIEEQFGDIPPLENIGQNIKLVLVYTHYSMFGPQSWPENIKEVGGYHVAKTKPLPVDVKEFIEQSEHEVIYVSFGSMVKTTTLPKDKLEAIVGALSELPQRVVMKWGEDHLPGNPKNIYVSNWLPQNDILAHPNVVAFYSHGGLLGLTEAFHHGVPVVAMPMFAEQHVNVRAIERKGFGVELNYSELTKDALLKKLNTVLDVRFRKRAKEISREWHDRPMSPMDTAIFWTEYAARHPGPTLRIAAVGKPWYQLAGLDVLFAVVSFVVVTLWVFIYVIKNLIIGNIKSKKD